jgi:flagellar motor switch protein FliM
LAKLGEVGFGQDILDPAAYDMGPMDDLRTAGLVMMQGSYQSWRITVQLGGGDRQGEILIAMRPQIMTAPATTDAALKWSEALRDALQDAPADLKTVLSRMTLPMSKIEEFEVGQVIQLAGTTVGSVSLVGPGGEQIAMARLGQVAGKRAVRVEVEVIELQDDTPKLPPVVAPLPELDTLVE